ncbi:MAG: hypothetical protein EOM67_09330 [Spirochaetia bacterium]|nr:hypothetical protein [Spirochaetia bacterium]
MKRFLLIGLFIAALIMSIGAKEGQIPTYEKGSQMFTFRAGPVIPAFIYLPYQDPTLLSFTDSRLKVGGYGAIRYQGFLSSYFALGGELGYLFDYARSDLFTSVPFQAKLTYIPLQGTFEIPISFGLGFAYNTFRTSSYLSFFTELEVGFSYYFTEAWGLSLSSGLQLIPEVYFGTNRDQTALGGFLPITLSISYRSNN